MRLATQPVGVAIAVLTQDPQRAARDLLALRAGLIPDRVEYREAIQIDFPETGRVPVMRAMPEIPAFGGAQPGRFLEQCGGRQVVDDAEREFGSHQGCRLKTNVVA